MEQNYRSSNYVPDEITIAPVGFTLIFTTDDGEFCSTNPSDLNAIMHDIEETFYESWYFHALYLNGKRMKFQIVTLLTEMEESQ
jgi:hypothetical protein